MRRNKIRSRKVQMFTLNLTALVDAFTILIVFLLHSFSTADYKIDKINEAKLPTTNFAQDPSASSSVIISKDGIYLADEKIISLNQGKVSSSNIDIQDQNFIPKLFKFVNKKDFDQDNKDKIKKSGLEYQEESVILLVDKNTPSKTLKRAIYTLGVSGFGKIQLGSLGQ